MTYMYCMYSIYIHIDIHSIYIWLWVNTYRYIFSGMNIAWARMPTRGQAVPAEHSRIGRAMDVTSFLNAPVGQKVSLLVEIKGSDDFFSLGFESPFGEPVAFLHEGERYEGMVTLYDVKHTGVKHLDSWILEVDGYKPLRSTPLDISDMGYVHDVCCGLGGFSTAFQHLGVSVVSAVDSCELAVQAFQLNHSCPTICGDIASVDVLVRMHTCQLVCGRRPVISAGFPCQPLSRQGAQLRQWDQRSKTLGSILRAAHLLRSTGLFLECVQEALSDDATQRQLQEFANMHGFAVFQRVLHLSNMWPSRKTRWFMVMLPSEFGEFSFPALPQLPKPPSVMQLMPFSPWPAWSMQDESQLSWTEMEEQVYNDPQYGSTNRFVQTQHPLPTALHSWGNALYACPCKCRASGLSPQTLRSGGLRGLAIVSGCWPHKTRHIHPRELQLFLGFPPFESVLSDCRAQLCLYGNAVSPIQVMWIWAHVMKQFGLLHGFPDSTEPLAQYIDMVLLQRDVSDSTEPLAQYIDMVLLQRDVSWPSPSVGLGDLVLVHENAEVTLRFNTSQTVGQLLQAEANLCQESTMVFLKTEGLTLPNFAFLQERTYEVCRTNASADTMLSWIPVAIEFLGCVSVVWVPPGLSFRQLLCWAGIFQFARLMDETSKDISADSLVEPWKVVTVQQDPDDVSFDLNMLEGFGNIHDGLPIRLLRTTESWISTGLWHLDQLIKSQVLLTWTGLDFAPLTVWLPSFAEAVFEFWPCQTEDDLKAWLAPTDTQVYAFVRESWGWSMLFIALDARMTHITLVEPTGHLAVTSRLIAQRVACVSGRPFCEEQVKKIEPSVHPEQSLENVMKCFHHELGLSTALISDAVCCTPEIAMSDCQDISPTVPMTASSLLVKPGQPHVAEAPLQHGLTARFLLKFARDLLGNYPTPVKPEQVQVLVIGDMDFFPAGCHLRTWQAEQAPLFLFVLVEKHWTFVKCDMHGTHLVVQQFDGLAHTSISELAPLCVTLKQAWGADKVTISTTWVLEQTKADSCGTIALGHFALSLGLITYEQAMHFEALHSSFAICSSLAGSCGFVGFGIEEKVNHDLAQLLPAKGVPEENVKDRIQAALKVFGSEAIGKALQANNKWAALKQLGNSRPRPFMWVTNQELQQHIQDRSQSEYGAKLDIRKKKTQKEYKKQPAAAPQIDPASLFLPPGLFITNTGEVSHKFPWKLLAKTHEALLLPHHRT